MFFKPLKPFFVWFLFVTLAVSTISGCSSGGGSSTPSAGTTTSGIAVDPYIVGAVFEEISPSGAVLQESTPSGENGRFTFPHPLTIGSIIQMKATAKGMHNKTPFAGMFKRQVDGSDTMVVSPLTTLHANGLTEDEIISLLADAGLGGLKKADVFADPMAGLNELKKIDDDDLLNLQAAIAVNQFLMLMGDYSMTKEQIDDNSGYLYDTATLIKDALNEEVLEDILQDISGPMAYADITVTMQAAINASANIVDTVVNKYKNNPTINPFEEVEELLEDASELALLYSVQQHRGNPHLEEAIDMGLLPDIAKGAHLVIGDMFEDNNPPTADAGPDQTVEAGSQVYLAGSGFSDNDDDPLLFNWAFTSKPAASAATLSDTTAADPSFYADIEGIYTLSLTVHDEHQASPADMLSILVSNGNFPPVADAGADQHVATGDPVTLDGSTSSDSDGDPLTYTWIFESMPVGSSAVLSDPSTVNPAFVVDLDGSYTLSLIVNDGQADSVADAVTITAATGNVAPLADAGNDVSVPVGGTVNLDGSGSSDADNDLLTYNWSLDSKPASSSAALSSATAVNPSFVADVAGSYALSLTVNDGTADSAPDTVLITAVTTNVPPVANGGPNQNRTMGDTVNLNGSGSSDGDNDLLTYSWAFTRKPASSSAALSNRTAVNPSFVADLAGSYVLNLTVNDGTEDSAPDTVKITVAAGNVPPVAKAGNDANVPVGGTVNLDGAGSNDANGDLLSYSWSFTSKPGGSSAALSNSTVVNPDFVADLEGSYTLSLTVNDGSVDSAPDTVVISATNNNVAPAADAGPDQNVAEGDTVNLDGAGSSDANGDLLSYSWSFTSKPGGSSAALSNSTVVNPSFGADVSGTYTLSLTVHDGAVDSGADTVMITAANNNVAPVANAGTNQNVFVWDPVNLNGAGSSDADHDPLTYSWAFTSKPGGSSASLANSTALNPSFNPDLPGTYVLNLTVNDGTVDSAPDTVNVTAVNSNVPPVADAGANQNVTEGDTVNLNAAGSSDADSDPLTYSWSFTSKPGGSGASLSNAGAVKPTFDADLPGSYVLSLTVNDGTDDSAPDTLTVTAAAAPLDCTACHGQPPAVGSHTVHKALPNVGTNCATCHNNNKHQNGTVDVNISATYNARSGSPSWSGATCSAVSCHGGKTTPDFFSGSINVNSQCTSCHASGTTQYNSYNSGKHSKHLGFGYSCTTCHNTSTLAQNHFKKLNTSTMEGPASATIGGGSTAITSYNAGSQTCTIACHGTDKNW